MKILEKSFKSSGFQFNQIVRLKDKAIYERKALVGKAKSFEVIVIKSHNGYEIGGTYIEPAETYPSSSQWGIYGWTYTNIEDAMKKYSSFFQKPAAVMPTTKVGAVRKRNRA